MRVIAGEARRIPLICPSGKDIRPTTDRIKETLFNIIQHEVPGSEFLDLFSGSGAIGIEAISRGAKSATFVEMAQGSIDCIEKNLEKTKLSSKSVLLPVEVTYGIKKLESKGAKFDIVFMDPPYDKGWEEKILYLLSESSILHDDSIIVIETSRKGELDFIDFDRYEQIQVKEYKTTRLVFLKATG
ncbi:MAG: 16S rRNA (guanine(966)-N(2))-methyltransferase RsmD [Lachnoclostridium sp.]|jgi:16S rRNA (guanine966-N2)-methyltransferase|nr:16S rRNA (guanine(966)-N(2))-methyltransferase RsmD [Lachnoclostridium sp.]